ncbi:hypothetical protein E4T56_gene16577 [Termitomyces sp. T112]|nr:hypothetical protein C0989_009844 [Termitomyces sp. Mn162]KAG5718614.1 hypothetical protein E4T56_gene16577 [Termitomyces sp. T112]KAH0581256.1 hypothetical protein H2248_012362 [Termitomyces sp. 'cryptogamus']
MSFNTTSPTSNMGSDDSSKTSGQFHSVKGNVVEGVGNMTGNTSWQQSGKQEHAAGEAETKSAQTKGYAEGTKDRIGGKKDAVVGAVSGDRSQQTQGNIRQEKGQTQQDNNRNL